MQLIPRYLVDNRITLIANEAGFVTEYRPVYQRTIQVYKGIDNVLEFRLLNADQKPIDVSSYTATFIAFDENKNLVIEHTGTLVSGDDSAASRGLFSVTVTENDLLNLKEQYLSYNVYLTDSNNNKVLTYVDTHFGNDGIMYVSGDAFPGPATTYSVSTFTQDSYDADTWYTETITAEPALNGNEALHTAAVYSENFVGDVTVQATLENQITGTTNWADVTTVTLNNEDEPKPVNFNGVYSYLRFKTTAEPSNITKILIRN